MMHLEIIDTAGTLCDPSYVYNESFERPLQPVWAILAVFYLIFCAEKVTKTRIWLANLDQLLVLFTCDMMHLEVMDTVDTLCDPSHIYI